MVTYISAGVCSCFNGSAGEDCSYNTTTPPTNVILPYDGLCPIGTRSCLRTNVFGDFASTSIWSKLKPFEVFVYLCYFIILFSSWIPSICFFCFRLYFSLFQICLVSLDYALLISHIGILHKTS